MSKKNVPARKISGNGREIEETSDNIAILRPVQPPNPMLLDSGPILPKTLIEGSDIERLHERMLKAHIGIGDDRMIPSLDNRLGERKDKNDSEKDNKNENKKDIKKMGVRADSNQGASLDPLAHKAGLAPSISINMITKENERRDIPKFSTNIPGVDPSGFGLSSGMKESSETREKINKKHKKIE